MGNGSSAIGPSNNPDDYFPKEFGVWERYELENPDIVFKNEQSTAVFDASQESEPLANPGYASFRIKYALNQLRIETATPSFSLGQKNLPPECQRQWRIVFRGQDSYHSFYFEFVSGE